MPPNDPQHLEADGISVSLTHSELNVTSVVAKVKSSKAGAIVLFAGCVYPTHLQLSLTTDLQVRLVTTSVESL